MAAQVIQNLRERERDTHVIRARFEMIEPMEQRGRIPMACLEIDLDELQLAIEAEDATTHAPAVQRRRKAQQRVDDADKRHEHHEQAPDDARQPEWQIALQERASR